MCIRDRINSKQINRQSGSSSISHQRRDQNPLVSTTVHSKRSKITSQHHYLPHSKSEPNCEHHCLACKPRLKCSTVTSRNFIKMVRLDRFTCTYHKSLVQCLTTATSTAARSGGALRRVGRGTSSERGTCGLSYQSTGVSLNANHEPVSAMKMDQLVKIRTVSTKEKTRGEVEGGHEEVKGEDGRDDQDEEETQCSGSLVPLEHCDDSSTSSEAKRIGQVVLSNEKLGPSSSHKDCELHSQSAHKVDLSKSHSNDKHFVVLDPRINSGHYCADSASHEPLGTQEQYEEEPETSHSSDRDWTPPSQHSQHSTSRTEYSSAAVASQSKPDTAPNVCPQTIPKNKSKNVASTSDQHSSMDTTKSEMSASNSLQQLQRVRPQYHLVAQPKRDKKGITAPTFAALKDLTNRGGPIGGVKGQVKRRQPSYALTVFEYCTPEKSSESKSRSRTAL